MNTATEIQIFPLVFQSQRFSLHTSGAVTIASIKTSNTQHTITPPKRISCSLSLSLYIPPKQRNSHRMQLKAHEPALVMLCNVLYYTVLPRQCPSRPPGLLASLSHSPITSRMCHFLRHRCSRTNVSKPRGGHRRASVMAHSTVKGRSTSYLGKHRRTKPNIDIFRKGNRERNSIKTLVKSPFKRSTSRHYLHTKPNTPVIESSL